MQLLFLALAAMIPFAQNPRIADAADHDALRESIKSFGLFKPLLVWKGTDHPEGVTSAIVIGGNQRFATLQKMLAAGMFAEGPLRVQLRNGSEVVVDPQAIPCIEFPGSWAEAKLVALRDNSQEGEWDWDQLPSYMEDLRKLFPDGVDLTLTGFDTQTLRDLESLATDPLVGLDNFGSEGGEGGEGQTQAEDGSQSTTSPPAGDTDTNFLTRKGAKVVIGNIRGKIPVALYERLASIVKVEAGELGTTDLTPILESMVIKLEKIRAESPAPAPVPSQPAPQKGSRKKK